MNKTSNEQTKKFKTSKVISISFAHLIHDIYSSFLAPILPILIQNLGISMTMAGVLNLFQRFPSLLNPLIGVIADRSAVRYYIIVTPTITAVSMCLIGIAPNYTVIAILLFIMGISSSFFHVPSPVLIRNVSGNRIGTGMSFYMVGGEFARTLGPIVILGAISLWGMEGTWKLIPFALATSVYLFFTLDDVSVKRKKEKSGKHVNAWGTFRLYLPFFLVITGITLFRAMMKSALMAFLPTYLNMEGETLWFGGIALSVMQFAGAAGAMFGGTISDKIGRKTTLMIAAIASPVFMWLFVRLGSFFIFPSLIFLGLGLYASTPVILAMIQDIKSERPAFLNGIYMTIGFVVGAIAVVLVGVLSDILTMKLSFEITAYIGVLAIPCVYALTKIKIQ